MAGKPIPQKVKKEIQAYVHILQADNLPIKEIILFGSYTKDKSHKWSDIDLCIVSPKFNNPFKSTQYLWSKRKISDPALAIEPIGFSPDDMKDKYSSLINEIKTHGIKIPFKKKRR